MLFLPLWTAYEQRAALSKIKTPLTVESKTSRTRRTFGSSLSLSPLLCLHSRRSNFQVTISTSRPGAKGKFPNRVNFRTLTPVRRATSERDEGGDGSRSGYGAGKVNGREGVNEDPFTVYFSSRRPTQSVKFVTHNREKRTSRGVSLSDIVFFTSSSVLHGEGGIRVIICRKYFTERIRNSSGITPRLRLEKGPRQAAHGNHTSFR